MLTLTFLLDYQLYNKIILYCKQKPLIFAVFIDTINKLNLHYLLKLKILENS